MQRFATVVVMAFISMSVAHGAERPVLRAASELPPSRFKLAAPPSRAFTGKAFLTETLPALRAEAERIRQTYTIADPALAKSLREGLAAIALLQRRPADALALVAEARAAAEKPQQRSLGMLVQAVMAASTSGKRAIDCSAGRSLMAATIGASNPAETRDEVRDRLLAVQSISGGFLAGIAEADIDPGVLKRGGLSLLEGLRLAGWRAQVDLIPPCRNEYASAFRQWLSDPKTAPLDIWKAREPSASVFAAAKPVNVAIWDGGYDAALFGSQLAIDPNEPLDGQDNDGNGVADDWNGPTYGYNLEPMASPLYLPSPELAPQLAFQMALAKGEIDLRAGADTGEATLFAQRARDAGQADQAMDALLYSEMGTRNHGTEVASEIADGAPFVRLYNVAALPFGENPRPVPVDEPQIARWVKTIEAAGPRLRGANVRVVNMSWGINASEIAERLLRTGGETDDSKAAARGRAMFATAEAALKRLIQSCPDILFVASAGNSNQSDEILASAPQSITAPNLIVVGATGINGLPTGFTTYGKSISIYAWGESVPLRAPGGMQTRGTGTSMAAPLVARAAASMLAVRPELKPEQLIDGLKATATTGVGGLKLLQSAQAVEWARKLR